MVSRSGFSPLGRAYLAAVIAGGVTVVSWSIHQLYVDPIGYPWFILAALTLVSGSATVKLPSSYASISISETFVFTAVLLYGPAAGTVIVALDALVISFWISKRHRELYRVLFNMSAPAVSAWCSANLFFFVARIAPLVKEPSSVNAALPALILFALTYFGLNSWLITFVIALERRLSPIKVWSSTFVWLSLNYFGGASLAILFVGYNRTIDLNYIGIIVPLLLVLYFTFKTTMGRVEDADRHVEQLNRLYLSTIETLAMAIDAKDQVTHGHIRRVQLFATNLAREVGVRDEKLLKAIEAAALLHDMGKLAVPEYILNKPGKLTDVEFEKMKLHASVGADILSAIDFPYPVVPIVRHHHENWNGTGYPDGLKGTEIPIGARILAVVDCFDALTSDRPYRPRLSDDEAISILSQRRGTMYDPLVVDTFLNVCKDIVPEPLTSGPERHALAEIASSTQIPLAAVPAYDEQSSATDELLTIHEIARALAGQAGVSDVGDVIAKHLRRLVPSGLCVYYSYDVSRDDLVATYANGERANGVLGIRISLGQRLSGWVAANGHTIVNSDAALDFGDIDPLNESKLRTCLSTPLFCENLLVGVLSLYSTSSEGFTDNHRRVVESIAPQIGFTFRRAEEFDAFRRHDPFTGLPVARQLADIVDRRLNASTLRVSGLFLVVIQVRNIKAVNLRYGRSSGDDLLKLIVRQARSALHIADILFRIEGDEFVALLEEESPDSASSTATRIRQALDAVSYASSAGETIRADVAVKLMNIPSSIRSFADLVNAARTDDIEAKQIVH